MLDCAKAIEDDGIELDKDSVLLGDAEDDERNEDVGAALEKGGEVVDTEDGGVLSMLGRGEDAESDDGTILEGSMALDCDQTNELGDVPEENTMLLCDEGGDNDIFKDVEYPVVLAPREEYDDGDTVLAEAGDDNAETAVDEAFVDDPMSAAVEDAGTGLLTCDPDELDGIDDAGSVKDPDIAAEDEEDDNGWLLLDDEDFMLNRVSRFDD